MRTEQLDFEINKLLKLSYKYHKIERDHWIMDIYSRHAFVKGTTFRADMNHKTMEYELIGIPIQVMLEPLSDRVPGPAELISEPIDNFFVLTLVCKGLRTGRLYYFNSEHCDKVVLNEMPS